MRHALPLLLVVVLLSACHPEPPPPIPETIRLLRPPGAVEIRVPELGDVRAPDWMEDAKLAEIPAPGWASEIPMFAGGEVLDSRAALLAPTGTTYRFRVDAGPGAKLVTAAGYPILDDALGRDLLFRVDVVPPDSETAETVSETALVVEPRGTWTPIEADLGLEQAGPVDVVLTVEGAGDAPPTFAGWAAPEIRTTVRPVPDPPPLDVVFVSLDTLRADRLGAWGHAAARTPFLDSLAREGVRFAHAVTAAPWTRPSHQSMFSGLYPLSKGGLESPTLAQVLFDAGFRTSAITGGGQVDYRFGFHDGIERFEVRDWLREPERVAEVLEEGRDRSDFLFLHTYEIHDPYDHDELARDLPSGRLGPGFSKREWNRFRGRLTPEEKTYVSALYDSGIAWTDRRLAEIFADLETAGLLDSALVVITSDHGEQLFEQGSWRHGAWLWQNQTHVPLIVRLPPPLDRSLEESGSGLRREIAETVRTIDLYPTILDLVGVPLEHRVQGQSLLPLLLSPEETASRAALAEHTNGRVQRKALIDEEWKAILTWDRNPDVDPADREASLYHLRRDPGEVKDLAETYPEKLSEMESRLFDIAAGSEQPEETAAEDLPEDLRERLKALGYID